MGYHKKLSESGQSERFSMKNDIAGHLNGNEGLDLGFCRKTLDILEAALFDIKKLPVQENTVVQTTPEPRFYISYNYREYGTYELADIEKLAASGQITSDYWIRTEDSTKWEPITTRIGDSLLKVNITEDKESPSTIEAASPKPVLSAPAEKNNEENKQLKKKLKRTKMGLITAVILCIVCIALRVDANNSNNILQSNYESLYSKYENVKVNLKIIVTGVKVGNTSYDGTWLTNPGNRLQSAQMRFLSPVITYDSILSETVTFYIKIINTNGVLHTGTRSPSGFSYQYEARVNRGENQSLGLSGFGTDDASSYQEGEYTVEIWYNNVCLSSGKVTIYP